jgi:hypothetical protein
MKRDHLFALVDVLVTEPQVAFVKIDLRQIVEAADDSEIRERVRAGMFLYAIFRYRLQESPDLPTTGLIPFSGFEEVLDHSSRESEADKTSSLSCTTRFGHALAWSR